MNPLAHLEWPFFDQRHREFAAALDAWAHAELPDAPAAGDVDATCRALVTQLGDAGWLHYCIAGTHYGASFDHIDTRVLCLAREVLARHHGLADFAFAMQALGATPITLAGTGAQKARYLPRVAQGSAIAAFALSEPDAGSDAAALQLQARADGDGFVLDGEKTWISNGGIADFYIVFARTGEAPGARGISAFIVDADTRGLRVAERIAVLAPHPLARLAFRACRVPRAQLLGEPGAGFKLALTTLGVLRASVAAAAVGFARCALAHALTRARTRPMFGARLADLQLTQAKLAQMATGIDGAALLTYRAAWRRDQNDPTHGDAPQSDPAQSHALQSATQEVAMAKMVATETAQHVIDDAVQLFGAAGVQSGHVVERLYREIRALRIYEGATEVQQMIIARELLKEPSP